jgi:hypothetical protein
MMAIRIATLVLAASVMLAAAGCGGSQHVSSSGSGTSTAVSAPPAIVAQANANCRFLLRRVKQLGQGVLAGPLEQLPTRLDQRVFGPAIATVETVATRQQALERAFRSQQYSLYANLFDPIIVLAQQRWQSGRAHDVGESKTLENLLSGLGLEQERAARAAGVSNCGQDFLYVMINSFTQRR